MFRAVLVTHITYAATVAHAPHAASVVHTATVARAVAVAYAAASVAHVARAAPPVASPLHHCTCRIVSMSVRVPHVHMRKYR